MYVCVECGALFEEPLYYTETHGFSRPPYENWRVCPSCYGEYAVAKKCDCCDEYITDTYIELDNGKRYCSNCFTVRELYE